jgi:hypothetical protein
MGELDQGVAVVSPELRAHLEAVYRKHARILEVELHYMRLQWEREDKERWWQRYSRAMGWRAVRRPSDEPRDYPV